MLLNVSVFMWFGAVCPWNSFLHNDVIPIYRLIPLGILVLLLRRLPMILAFHKYIREVEEWRHALFTGWFGPIGVSAIFYLYVSRETLRQIQFDGHEREDAAHLMEALNVVVWFLVICSIVCHGLSVPLGKLGFHLPRTISTALSSERLSRNSSRSRSRPSSPATGRADPVLVRSFRHRRPTTSERGPSTYAAPGLASFFGFVRTIFLRGNNSSHPRAIAADQSVGLGAHPEISRPTDPRVIGRPIATPSASQKAGHGGPQDSTNRSRIDMTEDTVRASDNESQVPTSAPAVASLGWQRSIRFPDE